MPMDGVHALVKFDYFSCKVQLEACDAADAESVVRVLDRWIQARGNIKQIVIDEGRAFMNSCVKS